MQHESVEHDHTAEGPTFPNGCHVAEVEIDPETGTARLVRYVVVDDFGTLVNPLLVEGQVQGGVVQGAGQVMLEDVVYDGEGQLLTGSYMDYAMPRAADMPLIEFDSHPVPATTNPLGAKGIGELGMCGGAAAIGNAVYNACGARLFDYPMTPDRVLAAMPEGP